MAVIFATPMQNNKPKVY